MSTNLLKIIFLSMLTWLCVMEAAAHEAGAPFSSAFAEPILLHHAHIEDEQKLNFVGFKDFRREDKDVDTFSTFFGIGVHVDRGFPLWIGNIYPFLEYGNLDPPRRTG